MDIISKHCPQDLEYLVVNGRPFYIPREFSVVLIKAVYLPLHANAKISLEELHSMLGFLSVLSLSFSWLFCVINHLSTKSYISYFANVN